MITNAGCNATIAPGGTASFGFNGSPGNVGTDVPANYVLNGAALGAGVPSLNINNVTVNDGIAGATAVFTVTLSQAATKTVTVNYATADGTAHAGTDYTAASGTLTFSPGTLTQSISVPISPDTTAKANETFQVNLSSAERRRHRHGIGSGDDRRHDRLAAHAAGGQQRLDRDARGDRRDAQRLERCLRPGRLCALAGVVHAAGPRHRDREQRTVRLIYTPAAGLPGGRLVHLHRLRRPRRDGHGHRVDLGGRAGAGRQLARACLRAVCRHDALSDVQPGHGDADGRDQVLHPGVHHGRLEQRSRRGAGTARTRSTAVPFDQSIRTQISQVRRSGGDVSVSFGGEAGQELAQAITNVSALTAAYQQVITAYGLTHIDFDIEGAAVADHASIDRRSQAIAALQQAAAAAGKTLDVSFTLPVLPTGLTADGLYVLQSALKYGVKISTVNVMAMDYGDVRAPNPAGQMGTYAIDSAKSTFTQLQASTARRSPPASSGRWSASRR